MNLDAPWSGAAILCDQDGMVQRVLRDDLEMCTHIQEGTPVIALFDPGSTVKAKMFLAEIRVRRAAFGWELNVPVGEHVTTLHFGGGLIDDYILIVGAVSTAGVSVQFYDELMRIKNEQMNALRSAMKDKNLQEQPASDAGLFTDFTQLNNELINLQRELAKKNAELTGQRERLAALNEELHTQQIELELQNEELRITQAALERSRREYADLYDFAPVGYFTLDEKGRIMQVNRAGAVMLGFDSSDTNALLKQPFIRFAAGSHKDTFTQHRRASCLPNASDSCEIQMVHNNHTRPFWVRLQSAAVDEQEEGTCWVRTIVSDITERKQAEEALQRSEARVRTIIEGSADAMIVVDQEGIIVFANPAAELLLGCPTCDLPGQPFGFPLSGDGQMEIEVPQPDGGVSIAEMSVVEIDWEGKTAYLASLRDVTARKRAEMALRESENLLLSIYRTVPVGICITNAEGRFVQVNRAYCRIYGYTPEELIDQSFTMIVPPERRAHAEAVHRAFIDGADELDDEWEVVRKDGARIVIAVGAGLMVREDGERMKVTVVSDITERKQAEAERERLIAELDAFAHTVAHDLKNPLNATIGFSEALLEDRDMMGEDEIVHYLQAIVQSGLKMRDIINALLMLAGVRRRDAVAAELLDMARIVQEAQARLTPMAEDAHAEIAQPPADAWPAALGFAPWIEEVWVNYLSNAIKYGGEPPQIELGAEAGPDGMARFWVRDHGPGIAPEDQERLFLPFTRIGQTHIEGHGLGLSIVERIVEKLGGEVGVESTPGEGSRFYFTLPASEE